MMVMTAKVDLKKILIILAGVAALILGCILIFSGSEGSAEATSAPVSHNDSRVEFLRQLGWQVNASPVHSGQVLVPQSATEAYDRYNALQKSQGYDLNHYAGKTVMRYVYRITNYPDATEPVYATLLVYKDQVIGGDITDTSPQGKLMPLVAARSSQGDSTIDAGT